MGTVVHFNLTTHFVPLTCAKEQLYSMTKLQLLYFIAYKIRFYSIYYIHSTRHDASNEFQIQTNKVKVNYLNITCNL